MLPIRDRLPTRTTPVVTYLLVATNILAYVWEKSNIAMGYHPDRFVRDWGLMPLRFFRQPINEVVHIFTSMFLHDPTSFMHLGGNMLFLWIFGDNVEDALGKPRFIALYLLSGITAALGQVFIDPTSTIPMVGASGAISGVLAAYGSLYPRAPVTVLNPALPMWFLFGPIIELPAWIIIVEYFIWNLLSGLLTIGAGGRGGVAFFAHLGGFVGGLLLVRVLMLGRDKQDHEVWKNWRPPQQKRNPYAGYRGPMNRHRRNWWL